MKLFQVTLLGIGVAALGLRAEAPSRVSNILDENQRAVLVSSRHPKAQPQFDRGRADASRQIGYVTLMLKPSPSQEGDLEQLLAEQQDRSSPNYHRWLSPEQFGDRFGLSRQDYERVAGWLQSHDLQIRDRARGRRWIAVSGSLKDIERTFRTEIHQYVIDGQRHIGNATDLSIPSALSAVVEGVRGLDDFWKSEAVTPAFTTPSGAHQIAPDDWATIYDVAPLYAAGIDGTGQRVGIIGRSSIDPADMAKFRSTFALPATGIEQHLIGPDPGVTNAASEAALDLEWAGAIARGATLVYVYASNFNDAAQGLVDQNLATVMSESFGVCEQQAPLGTRAIAQQANAQGITFVASSGDSGPADCDAHGFFGTTNGTPASSGFTVGVPASFPEVTAVGGTQFNDGGGQYWSSSNSATGASALSYIPEVAWNQSGAPGLLASGGGPSQFFPKPAWQAAPGVPSDGARDIPDVSFSSSGFPHDPYVVVHGGVQTNSGGTSAAAPSFAGVVALLNQYIVAKGFQSQAGLGNVNPELYRIARSTTGVFHDITQGDNMVPCAAGSPGCASGSMGYAAGPGYDLASGLGSIDVFNLVMAWDSPHHATTATVTAGPAQINLGDPVQLTATVSSAAASSPTGSVTFNVGRTILGAAPLIDTGGAAAATLTVAGAQIPVGHTMVSATYGGDANFDSSVGMVPIDVAAQSTGSAVLVTISPNPAHEGQLVRVSLTEEAGVATTITGWTINGFDDFFRFATDFSSTTLPAYGTLAATFASAAGVAIPSSRVYIFTGTDANGAQWSRKYTLTLVGAATPGIVVSGAPNNVLLNPSADPSCQWSHALLVQEQNGLSIELTRLIADGQDWTRRLQALFGTTRLAPFGSLQATVCWPGSRPSGAVNFELDGVDQTGGLVTTTAAVALSAPTANSGTLSVSAGSLTIGTPSAAQPATATIGVSVTGDNQSWSVSVFPQNQATNWLKVSPASGTGSQQVTIAASGAALPKGVYQATLIFQAPNAIPQIVGVPVAFAVGASPSVSIAGLTNAASFAQVNAPGMLMSVFGAGLSPGAQLADSLPLPLTMSGVSATVNGIAAPLYYVSPTLLNIQIPYEAGSGPAVLGVNNNGQVASYIFTIAPSAPGIFTDATRTIVPFSSGKPGDTIALYITGDGLTIPSLATGASPFFMTPIGLLPRPVLPVTLTVGGIAADIRFVGIVPGVAGVTQINFVIPQDVSSGVQPVVVSVGGIPSATANLAIVPD